tara:strand:+ start:262 stop:537 length:276 start_codon:yes stop_codon:yes gene_type:complete
MHHPHIVELLAVFDDKANDVVHIVMPMCAGGELFDRITKDRTQVKTVDAAVCFASEICGRIVTETSVSHAQRGQLGRSLIAVDVAVRTLAG